MNKINVLFYSIKCDKSKNLMTLLEREGMIKYFKLICVNGIEHKLPNYITETPALCLINFPKPIFGDATFKWLETIKQTKQKVNYNVIESGPIGFIIEEMSGLSDNFAYQNIESAQPKSFFSLEYKNNDFIFTAPEQEKIKEKEQKKSISDYTKLRKEQEQEFLEKNKYDHEEKLKNKKLNNN